MHATDSATDLLSTERVWYHGTADNKGLDEGDWMNPRKGNYEPCVWVTSCPRAAAEYARATAAVSGGEPVICTVTVWSEARVVEGDETTEGADMAVIRRGEYGVATAAILTDSAAYVSAVTPVDAFFAQEAA